MRLPRSVRGVLCAAAIVLSAVPVVAGVPVVLRAHDRLDRPAPAPAQPVPAATAHR